MLPDIHDAGPLVGPARARPTIGVDDHMRDLAGWLAQVVAFWRNQDDDPLGAAGVQLVEDVLCKSIEVRPALRSVLDDAERTRLRLTSNQAKVLRILGGRQRAVISGGAGTGKTLIAIEKSRQLAHEGRSVLLLCYNRPLADAIAIALRDEASIAVLSFHQLCERRIGLAKAVTGKDLLKESQEAYPGHGDRHLFDVQMPYALALSNELLDERYDALIVDEAQDFSDDYWFALEELLRDRETGTLYIFIDENQALYRKHSHLPVPDEPFHLTANCRNTAPIHRAGYVFYKGDAVDEPDLPGEAVELLAFEDDDAQADAVAAAVARLVRGGLRAEDVVVLLAKRPKAFLQDLLQRRRLPQGAGWASDRAQGNSVLVETVGRFKGLEAEAVVLWLGDEVVEKEAWEQVYVGTTRAKSLLFVVGSASSLRAMRPCQ
jgi:superfamily I DNA and RNA helicase